MKKLINLIYDENAQGLTEYAVLISMIATALVITAIVFRNQVSNVFNNITNDMSPAVNSSNPGAGG